MVIYVFDERKRKEEYESEQIDRLQVAMDKLFISAMLYEEQMYDMSSFLHKQGYQQNRRKPTQKSTAPKFVCIYGSVSYDGYNQGHAGFGVFWNNGEHKDMSYCLSGSGATHNIALLRAVDYAVRQDMFGKGELKIFTNNSYVINIFTKWHKKWRKNGWRLMTGEPPKNLALIQEVLSHIQNRVGDVTFHMVRWNDDYPPLHEARILARQAMDAPLY